MTKYLYYLLGNLILFAFACEEESGPTQIGSDPVIEQIIMRDKWNINSSRLHKVEVKVMDPQGFSNIQAVLMEVKNPSNNQLLFSDSLYDDGAYFNINTGDVIAGDGVYSNQFSAVQILPGAVDGDYLFSFLAIDKQNNQSSFVEQSAFFGPNSRPEIVNVISPDTLFSGTSGQIIEMAFTDDDGISDVIRGFLETIDTSNTKIGTTDFFNDGNFSDNGDLFANDSIYTLKLNSTFAANKKGAYTFDFYVEDSFNEQNINVVSASVNIENEVGSIISTSVPDSVEKPVTPGNTVAFELNAVVTDPQGLADVDSVYFLSEKPDGTFAGNGFRFSLLDDGMTSTSGDDTAGDGEYSIVIQIADSNDPGTYIFHFYMRDKVGQLTDVTMDSILVY